MVLTKVGAEPLGEDAGAQLDDGERKVCQQKTGDVTHEALSVQIPQFRQKTVDNQGERHEYGGQEHSNGEHGEHDRVHNTAGIRVGETDQRQNCTLV